MSRLFNGTSQWLASGYGSRPSSKTGPWTIAAWVYATAVRNAAADSRSGIVCCEQRSGGNNAIPFALTYGRYDTGWANIGSILAVSFFNGSSWAAFARDTVALTLNQWYHVAAVFETTPSRVLRLYRDGVQVGTSSPVADTALSIDSSFHIGAAWQTSPSGNALFPGRIAEVGFWSVALTPGEILRLKAGVAPWHLRFPRDPAMDFYMPLSGLSTPENDRGPNGVGFVHNGAPTIDVGPPIERPMLAPL